MRKHIFTLLAAALLAVFVMGSAMANVPAQNTAPQPGKATVKLTEQQKKELSVMHKEILEKRVQLIGKYVEYGVMSPEEGDKFINKLKMRQQKLEQNGYIPHWDKGPKRHCQ